MSHQPFTPARLRWSRAGADNYSLPALGPALGSQHLRLPGVRSGIVLESVLGTARARTSRKRKVRPGGTGNQRIAPTRFPFVLSRICCRTDRQSLPGRLALCAVCRTFGARIPRCGALVPVDLVVDHSIQIDPLRSKTRSDLNMKLEFKGPQERYTFMEVGDEGSTPSGCCRQGIRHRHQVISRSRAGV